MVLPNSCALPPAPRQAKRCFAFFAILGQAGFVGSVVPSKFPIIGQVPTARKFFESFFGTIPVVTTACTYEQTKHENESERICPTGFLCPTGFQWVIGTRIHGTLVSVPLGMVA